MSKSKRYNAAPETPLRVWIEWEFPSIVDYKTAEAQTIRANEIAAKINRMIARLGEPGEKPSELWWNERKQCFCFSPYPGGGFFECSDNGQWFNLEFFGRE